jgi:DNA-binding transcriptional regulator YdaS (Cro superfamily)
MLGLTTLSDALVTREIMGLRQNIYDKVATCAASTSGRYSCDEIRKIATIDPAKMRKATDDCARDRRELDMRIQEKNWTTELL